MGFRFLRMELADSTPVREVQLNGNGDVSGIRVVLVYGSGSVSGLVKFENGPLPEALRVSASVTNDEGFYAGRGPIYAVAFGSMRCLPETTR